MVPSKLVEIILLSGVVVGVMGWGYARTNALYQEILSEVDVRRRLDPEWADSIFVPIFRLHRKYYPSSRKCAEYTRVKLVFGMLFAGCIGLFVVVIRT